MYYPLIDPKETTIYTAAIDEDIMTMCTVYRNTRTFHDGNIFSMFASIPVPFWTSYLVLFVTMITVASVGSSVLRLKNWNIVWTTTRAFITPTGSLVTAPKFLTWISVLTLMSIFISFYAVTSMSSDLATLDDPVAITSYDDIIERGIKVALFQERPENDKFANAPIGSKQHALFKNTMPANTFLESTHKVEEMHLGMKELAYISRPLAAKFAALVGIGQMKFPADGRMFVGSDDSALKYMNVYVLNSRWRGTELYDIIHRR